MVLLGTGLLPPTYVLVKKLDPLSGGLSAASVFPFKKEGSCVATKVLKASIIYNIFLFPLVTHPFKKRSVNSFFFLARTNTNVEVPEKYPNHMNFFKMLKYRVEFKDMH